MDSTPPYGSLATRFAALQQRLSSSLEEGLAPHPPAASGSLALRADNKVLSSKRPPCLIGASKTQPADMLEAAICLGLTDFGENKVQEAYAKWPALKAKHPQVRLHLIGPLQSNKAAEAVALFDVIQTIDRIKIADALAAACEKAGKHPLMLIQVNTGEEPQKAGVAPREAAALLAHCRSLGLNVVGLMCVPPEGENPAPHFALLKKMANTLGLSELSMGMSGDFETAIRLGSTMVRVGTALFGSRL
jgi:pyridoxal phosphate enzyme (YggS family)